MPEPYFWSFGRCERCDWPHHLRVDVPARRKRWWRQDRDAYSVVFCCNCSKRTPIDGEALDA